MKYKQLLKLLLASLILFAYQSHNSHLEHFLEKKSECNTCISQKESLNLSQSLSFLLKNTTLESTQSSKERIKTPPKTLDVLRISKVWVDFEGLRFYSVKPYPIGYDANAPPLIYS